MQHAPEHSEQRVLLPLGKLLWRRQKLDVTMT